MSTFIERSSCNGVIPKNLLLGNEIIRNKLLSKLMQQRSVMRLIIAPDGYGKSTLAKQYCDVVFSFNKVFWLNCKSPCFLRDLDDCLISKNIVKIKKSTNLVVFDGLGSMNIERLEKLSNEIDSLLNNDIEVILTTTPINTVIFKKQPDLFCVNDEDLLLSDEEIKNNQGLLRSANSCKSMNSNFRFISFLQEKEKQHDFIKGFLEEDYPTEIFAALFIIYTLKKGNLQFLKEIISISAYKLILEISQKYKFFSLTKNADFNVPELEVCDLKKSFYSKLEAIRTCLGLNLNNDLGSFLYKKLIKHKQYGRAMQVAVSYCNIKFKVNCLKNINFISLDKMYFNDANDLFDNVALSRNVDFISKIYHGCRLGILGDIYNAQRYAYMVLDSNKANSSEKLLSLFIYMFFSTEEEKEQCCKIMKLYTKNLVDPPEDFSYKNDEEIFNLLLANYLSKIFIAIFENNISVFEYWLSISNKKISKVNIVCAIAVLINIEKLDYKLTPINVMSKFLSVISNYLHMYSNVFDKFDYINYMLVKSYLGAEEWINRYYNGLSISLGSDILKKHDAAKIVLETELLKYSKKDNLYCEHDIDKIKESIYLPKDSKIINLNQINSGFDTNQIENTFVKGWTRSSTQVVPRLYIKVFGKINVCIGKTIVPQKYFSSSKIKLLITLLVIANGNEFNKSHLADYIWPKCSVATKRRNINALCYRLKKALCIPNGECPYIITSQNSYSLCVDLVESDLQNLENLCERLTLGPINSTEWLSLVKNNSTIFDGLLLPSERDCVFINQKREEYKNKIVDSLIAASSRLADVKDLYQALWFAYKALSVDDVREDAYKNLMKIQIAAGQRSSAIKTYEACTKSLKSNSHLKPSGSILELYRRAINSA